MASHLHDIIRRHCQPLEPVPTGTSPVLRFLPGIRAVLFDIYGTLFISASGDVGTAIRQGQAQAFEEALRATGITAKIDGQSGANCLLDEIQAEHKRLGLQSVEFPEVEIVEIWRKTLKSLCEQGRLPAEACSVDLRQLAVEYEVRANPVWPTPDARECLARLRKEGVILGLVSNAQFFTIELFPALFCEPAEELGFDRQLQYFSYQYAQAKPGEFLYRRAAEELKQRGMETSEALFVGNDLLNDVLPAKRVGFRTALFAGDARSLRLRKDDPRVQDVAPDLIVTDLVSLVDCVC